MKKSSTNLDDEMRPDYDFAKMRGGVRGKHAGGWSRVVLVQLDADVVAAFPTADAEDEALRRLLTPRAHRRRTTRPGGAAAGSAQRLP